MCHLVSNMAMITTEWCSCLFANRIPPFFISILLAGNVNIVSELPKRVIKVAVFMPFFEQIGCLGSLQNCWWARSWRGAAKHGLSGNPSNFFFFWSVFFHKIAIMIRRKKTTQKFEGEFFGAVSRRSFYFIFLLPFPPFLSSFIHP